MSGWKRAWWISGTALFLIVVGGLVVRLEVIRRDVERWETYQKECHSRGEDLGIEAWLPPAVPEPENVATHPWIAAMLASEKSREAKVVGDWSFWRDGEVIEGPDDGKSWFESNPDKAAEVMARGAVLAADFKAIREAAGRPGCQLPAALNRDMDLLSGALRQLRNTGEMLSVHADAALAQNQEAIAVEDIEALLRMGDHLQSQRFLLSVLTGKQIKASALSVIEVGLQRRSFSSASRLRLRSALENPPTGENAATTMRLERGLMLEKMGKALERARTDLSLEGFMHPPARRVASFKYSYCTTLDTVLHEPPTRAAWEAFDHTLEKNLADRPSADLGVASLYLYHGIVPTFFEHADRIERIRAQLAE